MNKEANGGRKSFELMGGTQDQQSCSLLKSFIYRTVSAQALPKKILRARNILLPASVLLIGICCFDSWHITQQSRTYTNCADARSNAFSFAMGNKFMAMPDG